MVADVNVRSAKSVRAVVPLEVGVTLVNAPPPAAYVPELPTSFVVVYAVVAAVNEALFEYRASLKALPVDAVKLCVPVISSLLNDVHMKFPVNAILESPDKVYELRVACACKRIIHCCAITLNRLF